MKSNPKVVCPFCPLHCDDLLVGEDGTPDVNCSIAKSSFATALDPSPPRIGDSLVSLADVTQHAHKLVHGIVPLVVASSVPISAAKTLEQLHRRAQIDWSLQQSDARAAMQRTISRDGMVGATLGDVRKHADCIWIVGNQDHSKLPRIDDFTRAADDQVNHLSSPEGVTARQLGDLLDAVRREQKPKDASIVAVYEAAMEANYFAVIWVDDGFQADEAEVASALLLELIAILNEPTRRESRRAVFVTFDEATTARSVSLWRRNEIPAQESNGVSDRSAVVIQFGDSIDPENPVSIQVGGRDGGKYLADVYVPASIEGVHEADMVIRGDGAVTLPLHRFVDSDLPTCCDWLTQWVESSTL